MQISWGEGVAAIFFNIRNVSSPYSAWCVYMHSIYANVYIHITRVIWWQNTVCIKVYGRTDWYSWEGGSTQPNVHLATHSRALQHTATSVSHCNTLQQVYRTATHCNKCIALQHTATSVSRCKTWYAYELTQVLGAEGDAALAVVIRQLTLLT